MDSSRNAGHVSCLKASTWERSGRPTTVEVQVPAAEPPPKAGYRHPDPECRPQQGRYLRSFELGIEKEDTRIAVATI